MSMQCPACSCDGFTVTGLSQHLAKSRNPRCQALYRQSHSQINEPQTELNDPYYDELEELPNNDGGYGEDEFVWNGKDEFVWTTEQTSGGDAPADDDASESDDGLNFKPEWEPPVTEDNEWPEPPIEEDNDHGENQRNTLHPDIQARAQGQHGCIIVPYPDLHAGQQITDQANCHVTNVEYRAHFANAEEENLYHPFTSKMDWEVTRWANFVDLVCEHLSLSFKNVNGLNSIVDHELPTGRPKFKREQIVVAGEAFDVYYRNIIECVRSLYGDPDFTRYLAFAPERHYTDKDETVHLFHDMHTGKWWWDTQKKLDQHCPGGTIIPIIISSDKTQVTLFCNKSAYPPSCGVHILLAYLPCMRLEHITNKASCRRTMANLYHACLSRILAPLKSVGLNGLHMASGDGALHHCHLLFASFVGDYPEQLLATGIKFGKCPKCNVDTDETSSNTAPFHLWKISKVLDALAALDEGNLSFIHACSAAGIKPIVHPFWEDLPFTNIFHAIMPDVLHQLYQGLIKHLLGWLSAACGEAEIYAHCQRLPPNHHIRLFRKGITSLSRISGAEHTQICRFLLGIIIGICLPNNLNGTEDTDKQETTTITLRNTTKNYYVTSDDDDEGSGVTQAHCLTQLSQTFSQFSLFHKSQYDQRLAGDHEFEPYHSRPPDMSFRRLQTMMKHPSAKAINIDKLVEDYGATYFHKALACYITQLNHTNDPIPFCSQTLDVLASSVHFPFQTLPTFHKIKWLSVDSCGHGDAAVTLDSVLARPQRSSGSCPSTHCSDMALMSLGPNTDACAGIEGFRVGQVRVIFAFPSKLLPLLFPPMVQVPSHLAYIKWFTPFPPAPDRYHRLYKLS
ncbi:hypothetical protein DFH29DRAFT_985378 [Suillus ampliporus]|nr:hypothetical protein DFH29DRAFT_985378 [Suillus ampliporus]